MTPPNNLELKGSSQFHPPAEVLCEIRQGQLDGSLRLSHGEQKVIVYFRGGEIIFAVSNARASRLFEILLRQNRILKQSLIDFPDFANDHAFADFLVKQKILLREELNLLFVSQITGILQTIAAWETGDWIFSPLVRLREGINFKVSPAKILVEYGRQMASETIDEKLLNRDEIFLRQPAVEKDISLLPKEAFVLSGFKEDSLKLSEILESRVLPEQEILKAIYTLWLGGFLLRLGWNAAFSPKKIQAILGAKISLVREAATQAPAAPIASPVKKETVEMPEPKKDLTLDEYLERVEGAANNYDILGLDAKAPQAEIKPAYFQLAKRFHPDIFHKETDPKLAYRVQEAFTQLAQAYEALKTKESRETYDFKIRKELAEMEKRIERRGAEAGQDAARLQQNDQAAESFEKGFDFLMEENYEDAVPLLARAVHYSPQTPRYHAYYGKALSVVEQYRHKAETELQTAIKLDPQNQIFRIMLVEFFIQYGLFKRAEGELNRLLATSPDHKEARILLDSLPKK